MDMAFVLYNVAKIMRSCPLASRMSSEFQPVKGSWVYRWMKFNKCLQLWSTLSISVWLMMKNCWNVNLMLINVKRTVSFQFPELCLLGLFLSFTSFWTSVDLFYQTLQGSLIIYW